MRLRLTVRRHGLPETPVIWIVDTTTSPTIAQLLEQVNDAVPIDTAEWGYEDYAVELTGRNGANYECLHYQTVNAVFKEDDEVMIRPLLTQDLKIRKISGRHQISADGKRLYDGLPFGRPLLRAPRDRPEIKIPPRKKRRIIYQEREESDAVFAELEQSEEVDSGNDEVADRNKQLVLHADFEDDSEEDDVDFEPSDDENEDESLLEDTEDDFESPFQEEQADESSENARANSTSQTVTLPALKISSIGPSSRKKNKNASVAFVDDTNSANGESFHASRASVEHNSTVEFGEKLEGFLNLQDSFSSGSRASHGDQVALQDVVDEATRAKIRKLHSAFPSAPLAVCKYIFDGTGGDMGEAYEAINRGFVPVKSKSSITEIVHKAENISISRIRLGDNPITAQPAEDEVPMRDSYEEPVDPNVERHDQNGFPCGSFDSPMAGNIIRFLDDEPTKDSVMDDSTSDSSEEDAISSSDSGGTSGDETSEDTEESDSSSSESDSDSSSDASSDDDAPEQAPSKPSAVVAKEQSAKLLPKPKGGVPNQGKQSTKTRNIRRRDQNRMDRYKKKGIVPEGITLTEFKQLKDLNYDTPPQEVLAAVKAFRVAKATTEGRETNSTQEFELRRQELLASLAAGGIEVGREAEVFSAPQSQAHDGESIVPLLQVESSQSALHKASASAGVHQPTSAVTEPSTRVPAESESFSRVPEPASPQNSLGSPQLQHSSAGAAPFGASRRSRLDIGAGKRMLFNALGVRPPKTKEEEEKLRNTRFMPTPRPVKVVKDTAPHIEGSASVVEYNSEDWREKVTYRAVECVQEDIELTEPPFPFVQRWDPQQQSTWSQSGKRKKNQRDQSQYYNEDHRVSKKQKQPTVAHYTEEPEYLDASYQPSYLEDSFITEDGYSQMTRPRSDDIDEDIGLQLCDEAQTLMDETSQEPDDLAQLPEDPSTLPDLSFEEAKIGMTIAFKQLDFSAATQWQPQLTGYRTAIIIDPPKGNILNLRLAMRDRKQIQLDEAGERIYGKFEMADSDDDSIEAEDDGSLDLHFNELCDPKIVRNAPPSTSGEVVVDEASQNSNGPFVTASVTSSYVEEPEDAQLSHVAETPLQSEAPDSKPQGEDMGEDSEDVVENAIEEALERLPKETTEDIEDEFHEAPQPPIIDEDAIVFTNPLANGTALDVTPAPVSEATRQRISTMIEEAGFRSSIPSSIMRDLRLDGIESPGDAAVFEKLMRDMTEVGSAPYSPKFNGLGSSSPIRRHIPRSERDGESSASFDFESSQEQTLARSDLVNIQLSEDIQSSPPDVTEPREKPETSSWVTDLEDDPPTPSGKRGLRHSSVKKPAAKKVPIGRAQALWDALQGERRTSTTGSPPPSDKMPEFPNIGFEGTEEKDVESTVEYPKLSVGSSFTSQITDHGRQPDFDFDDSVAVSAEVTTGQVAEATSIVDAPQLVTQSELPTLFQSAHRNSHQTSEPEPSYGEEIPASKPNYSERLAHTSLEDLLNPSSKNVPMSHQDVVSSDDEFPSLDHVLSQPSQSYVKPERTASILKSAKSAKENGKATAEVGVEWEHSDHSTPRAFQKQSQQTYSPPKRTNRGNENHTIKTRASNLPASQPAHASRAPAPSQSSELIDLTFSSDIEDGPAVITEESEGSQPQKSFQRYEEDSDHGVNERQMKKDGRATKTRTTIGGEARTRTSNELSQASTGAQNRRKKSFKYC